MDLRLLTVTIIGLSLVSGRLLGCTRNLKEERYTTEDARLELLIAGDASTFKDSLRQRRIDHYRPYSNIDVVNIDKLRQVDTADDDVVVIMDTCPAQSRLNPSTKGFLDRIDDRCKVEVLMTADDPDWEFTYLGVDALTAVSKPDEEKQIFERLRTDIDRIAERTSVLGRPPRAGDG